MLRSVNNETFARMPIFFLETTGKHFVGFLKGVGEVSVLAINTIRVLFTYRLAGREVLHQFVVIGNKSIPIVFLIAFFTGLVMALQLTVGLGRFGLQLYVGQIIALSIFRELGPVLTSLMIAARVGSGIAAELGSMVVTEQVLAIKAMGASPIQKLVVPRVIVTTIVTPLLTVMADLVGMLGGMLITVRETGVTSKFYIDQVSNSLLMDDFVSGVIKAAFFGFFISIIACFQGLNTVGGTEGVGRQTTRAVVYSSITIFVSDFFLTKLIIYF